MKEYTNVVSLTTEVDDIPKFISPNTLSTNVWFAGCDLGCVGCHNDPLLEYREKHALEKVKTMIDGRRDISDWIVFMGGEPFYNEDSTKTLYELVEHAHNIGFKIMIYTGHIYNVIKNKMLSIMGDEKCELFFDKYVDYIKTGVYDEENKKFHYSDDYQFASVNQKVYSVGGNIVYEYDMNSNKIINNLKQNGVNE